MIVGFAILKVIQWKNSQLKNDYIGAGEEPGDFIEAEGEELEGTDVELESIRRKGMAEDV